MTGYYFKNIFLAEAGSLVTLCLWTFKGKRWLLLLETESQSVVLAGVELTHYVAQAGLAPLSFACLYLCLLNVGTKGVYHQPGSNYL